MFVSLVVFSLFAATYVVVAAVTGGAGKLKGFTYVDANDAVTSSTSWQQIPDM